MKMKRYIVVFAVVASIALLTPACNPPASQAPAPQTPETKAPEAKAEAKYDRQGLLNLMKQYLAALVAHDPKAVPFAGQVKFFESTAEIPVGEGLWITASGGPGPFQIYAADPVAQQVACLVTMKENNKDVLLGARLKTVDQKIAEAEHLVIRDDLSKQIANGHLAKARPAFSEDLAPEDKTAREEMLKAGEAYYVALTGEDGKLAPFADDCERRENGMTTAGTREKMSPMPITATDPETKKMMEAMAKMPKSCEGQISTGAFTYITDIKNRRVEIADEQTGLAVGFSMFWHKSDVKTVKVKNVPGVEEMPSFQGTFNLPAMHIYKIKKGKIYDIEAIGFTLPYGTKGWQ
jgi:hypothetical protein